MVKVDCGTILVVDDDDATRLAAVQVAVRLGYDVCAAENAELVLERLDDTTPALAVVKVELPGMSGLEVMRELHDRFGDELPVILLAHETDALERTAGLMLGADDYLQEPIDTGELLARVRRSLRRAKQSAPDANGATNGPDPAGLSPREREILSLLAVGRTQREIATTLVLSSKTVGTHIQHVLAKLGVHSRAEAVSAAYRRGLVDLDVTAHLLDAELIGVD